MSSAILYLAIVAIWACVLVPRWVHRSHENPSGQDVLTDGEDAADHGEESFAIGEPGADAAPHADSGALAEASDQVVSTAETDLAVHAEFAVHAEYAVHTETTAQSGFADYVEFAAYSDRPGPQGPARPAGPPISRAHIVQARRRTLTLLVTLAVAAIGCTVAGLTKWWVIVPPTGMLGLYLLLLREAVRADAEITTRRAEAHARAVEAAQAAQAAREHALAASAPQRTAEIIDISARTAQARDQLYDQYADAAVRAVGD